MTVTTINEIPSGGSFVITYPSAVSISSVSTCSVIVGGITYTMTCGLTTAARKITMTTGLTSTIAKGTSV